MSNDKSICYIYGKHQDNLLSSILLLCILGPGIQFSLNALFAFGFNLLLVEVGAFVLFLFLLPKSNNALKVNENFYTMIVAGGVYILSLAFVNNSHTSVFLSDFIRNCFFIIIVLTFKVNYEIVLKQAKWISILDIILIESLIVSNSSAIKDYMTFGFHFMCALSFLFLYYANKKNTVGLCVCCGMCLQMLTYSARSNWYMTGILLLILLYMYSKNKIIKIVGTVAILVGIYFYNTLLNTLLDFLATNFDGTTYAVRNLQEMLSSTNSSGVFGDRSDIYSMAITAIREHPFGMGIGGFSNPYAIYPHNLLFDIWLTFGWFLGTALIVYIVFILVRAFKSNQNYAYRLLLTWSFVNFTRLLTTHTFVCEPMFFLVVCLAINGLQRRQNDDYCFNTHI